MTPTPLTAEGVLADIGYDGFVRALFSRSGDLSKDFAHAALGMVTEIHELRCATDPVNLIEEASDLLFFMTALVQVVADLPDMNAEIEGWGCEKFDAEFSALLAAQIGTTDQYVDHLCNTLLDHAKRWVGYGKAPENLHGVMAVGGTLVQLALQSVNIDFEADEGIITLVNVKKLLQRYKGLTFNAQNAINRDTGAERVVLEAALASAN